MDRLVKDGKIFLDGTLREYEKEKLAFEKLEKIEDIEEELRMPLVDFFNILFVKKLVNICVCENEEGRNYLAELLSIEPYYPIHKGFVFRFMPINFDVSKIIKVTNYDYGKTWWVIKEELK